MLKKIGGENMKLFIGLGNPGKKYENTRHNVGFMFVDAIVAQLNGSFQLNSKLRCAEYNTFIGQEKIIFIKPLTYMNLSGEAVRLAMDYYNIEIEDIVVIYDDLDLPTAKIRLRENGSSGGHKGMQSIIDHTSTNSIKRIRIGIGSEKRDVIDHVLGKFSKTEKKEIDLVLSDAYKIFEAILKKSFHDVMSQFNA